MPSFYILTKPCHARKDKGPFFREFKMLIFCTIKGSNHVGFSEMRTQWAYKHVSWKFVHSVANLVLFGLVSLASIQNFVERQLFAIMG